MTTSAASSHMCLCTIYCSNVQKKKEDTEMNYSNLSLLKRHINTNILTSSQSYDFAETAERQEATALKCTECSGQQLSLESYTFTKLQSLNVPKKRPFLLCWSPPIFSPKWTILSGLGGWDTRYEVISLLVKKRASSSSSNLKTKVNLLQKSLSNTALPL